VILVRAGHLFIDAEPYCVVFVRTRMRFAQPYGNERVSKTTIDRRGRVDRFRSGVARLESREVGEADARVVCAVRVVDAI
jgi:hypothetical protein